MCTRSLEYNDDNQRGLRLSLFWYTTEEEGGGLVQHYWVGFCLLNKNRIMIDVCLETETGADFKFILPTSGGDTPSTPWVDIDDYIKEKYQVFPRFVFDEKFRFDENNNKELYASSYMMEPGTVFRLVSVNDKSKARVARILLERKWVGQGQFQLGYTVMNYKKITGDEADENEFENLNEALKKNKNKLMTEVNKQCSILEKTLLEFEK